jgi:hypothetical protein
MLTYADVCQVTLLSLQYLNADHNLISQVPSYQYSSSDAPQTHLRRTSYAPQTPQPLLKLVYEALSYEALSQAISTQTVSASTRLDCLCLS